MNASGEPKIEKLLKRLLFEFFFKNIFKCKWQTTPQEFNLCSLHSPWEPWAANKIPTCILRLFSQAQAYTFPICAEHWVDQVSLAGYNSQFLLFCIPQQFWPTWFYFAADLRALARQNAVFGRMTAKKDH